MHLAPRVSTNLYSRLLRSYTPLSLKNDLPYVNGRFALGRSGPQGGMRSLLSGSGSGGVAARETTRTKEEDLKVILFLLLYSSGKLDMFDSSSFCRISSCVNSPERSTYIISESPRAVRGYYMLLRTGSQGSRCGKQCPHSRWKKTQ